MAVISVTPSLSSSSGFKVGDIIFHIGNGEYIPNGFIGQIIQADSRQRFYVTAKGSGYLSSDLSSWRQATQQEIAVYQGQNNQGGQGSLSQQMIASMYQQVTLPSRNYGSFSTTQMPYSVPKKPRKPRLKKAKVAANLIANSILSLDSVIMSQEKRDQIKQAISQISNDKQIFQDWGFDEVFEKGTAITLLFYGVPGTGKTLTAQAIANELGADLKIVGTADLESSEPGGPERAIKALFAQAKQTLKGKQRIILFDECDSLLTDRNEAGLIIGAQINTLLGEIERHKGVVILTTNRLGKLDPALERRIAAKIEFEFPNEEARKLIWQRLIPEKCPLSKDVDFTQLAKYLLAGGNIKNAVLNAARMAAHEKASELTMDHFIICANREVDSLEAWAQAYDDVPHQHQLSYTKGSNGLKIEKSEKKEATKTADIFGGKN